MQTSSITTSLVTWVKTFDGVDPRLVAEDLTDGVVMAQVLAQIAPEYFDAPWLSKIKRDAKNNWRLKVSNLKKILKGILDYYAEGLAQQITGFQMPDVNAIGEQGNLSELGRLLQLILGCAVNCDRKQEYIQTIMGLEEEVQHVVMNAIQELMMREAPSSYAGDSYSELGDQLKRAVEELQAANAAKEQIAQRCHELDMQVAVLQEEKNSLQQENEKLLERLNRIESLEDPSCATGVKHHQMQQKLDVLQDEVYKLETARDEYRIKVEVLEKEALELQQRNEELQKLAEESRLLKDELDILRHVSDKVEQYELTIESYKKKLEDLSDLKRQLKALEDKNTMYMQQNMELEEETKRAHTLKTQVDMYKKQVQELHVKLTEETRKADKAEFESKRLAEKQAALVKEKERLTTERDSLKETIEELRCMQLQNERARTQGEGRPGSLSDTEMLEAVPPEIREKLIRLQHENKMLKLRHKGSEDEQVALLQSMLDDAKARASELETENRIANQRIIELEGQIQDIQESQTAASSQEGSQLRQKLNSSAKRLHDMETELTRKNSLIENLEEQIRATAQKTNQFQELLNKKDEEMRAMEERYKKYLEKAKNVIKTMDSKGSTGTEIASLRHQLQEKDKIIMAMEKEAEKAKAVKEKEERLITTAFYKLGAELHRKATEERLMQNSTNQSFLARQRQATSRRLNAPGITPSEFFDY